MGHNNNRVQHRSFVHTLHNGTIVDNNCESLSFQLINDEKAMLRLLMDEGRGERAGERESNNSDSSNNDNIDSLGK
jgi:hypothetical protein